MTPTAYCGKCRREMTHVKRGNGPTAGICPEHGVMFANPKEYRQ